MNKVSRDELKTLFTEALELPEKERVLYLEKVYSDHPEYRKELASLLEAHNKASGFFQDLGENVLPETPLESVANNPSDPLEFVGRQIAQYDIVEKLGSGGMGVVYKAHDRKLGRPVALKFLPPHLSIDKRAKDRFIIEAKAASVLDHVNICTIYDIGEIEGGQLYISMAFYQGETLKEKIASGPIPLIQALDYAKQVTQGLIKAHASKIVHRDIKPANIMVTNEGIVKILDFGLAKVPDVALTRTTTTLGTVAYMSPEQVQNHVVDFRTDLWSLGTVLYEMLTGIRPFKGDNEQVIIYFLLNSNPEPLSQFNKDIPPALESVVTKCLSKNKVLRYQAASDLLSDLCRCQERYLPSHYTVSMGRTGSSNIPDAARSRISYRNQKTGSIKKHRAFCYISFLPGKNPDEKVRDAIYDALSTKYDVFCDSQVQTHPNWIEHTEEELSRTEYLILLLSEHSAQSEMLVAVTEMAFRLAQERNGYPVILPIRLGYKKPFTYPMSAFLGGLDGVYWENENDTPHVIEALRRAVDIGVITPFKSQGRTPTHTVESDVIREPAAAAQPDRRLELPEGTMDPESTLYVERPTDKRALDAIARQGVTITIKGPRQMGKSSLLVRMMAAASKAGKKVVFLDFQLFERSALKDTDTFFRQFCTWLSFKCKVEDQVEKYWQWPLGNSQCCTLYVEDCILKVLDLPLVLAMDEVERVFETGFRSDFFGMLRSWHNDRATDPIWRRLDLALVTSTEPYQLIENLNQSPFNVGEIIDLSDFSVEQVNDLNNRHGVPLSDEEIQLLMDLLDGHPYLTRKALYQVAEGIIDLPELLASASDERGPFGDHLRYHLFRLHGQNDLIDGFRKILHGHACQDEGVFWRLRGAGLIRRDGRSVIPRCKLYQDFFTKYFDV